VVRDRRGRGPGRGGRGRGAGRDGAGRCLARVDEPSGGERRPGRGLAVSEGVDRRSLYLRWRPGRFADVLGQEHVTRTLRNAVAASRVAHAYRLCGPRGTGKTSIARILFKAMNCERPVEG